ncbi:VOC family protein [Cryptosporangium aurantiacum]|uniref:Catechol 2,3-dioxygenase n=1 Tax=Cryptosporangium aurantiacum TaxID=134849 RepID=A0A1M7RLL6_9ACTN|nr:VOC family protein [Cryptosporangium aurantiacum]SHN47071.1 Catechol 2,3-dioxygenase [Cryptosporangium aurantiacum]
MEGALEVVVLPVRDIEASKRFYAEQLGFTVDIDEPGFVQLTPVGSGCSVQVKPLAERQEFGVRPTLLLVVADVDAARAELAGRGVAVSPVSHYESTGVVEGRGGRWNSFVFFDDPDGYPWAIQERPAE